MNKVEEFWTWFQQHNDRLIMLGELTQPEQNALLQALQEQLTRYCEGLYVEVGEPTPGGRTLTFSAEGNTELFEPLLSLTDNAPILDWWDIIPFKQPKGKDLRVLFDKYTFNTKEMMFLQLENEAEPDILGLRIALPHPVEDEDQLVGVYVTIEALIGEFDCATLIGYLETAALPQQPQAEGYRLLDDLPEFIEWFKTERDR